MVGGRGRRWEGVGGRWGGEGEAVGEGEGSRGRVGVEEGRREGGRVEGEGVLEREGARGRVGFGRERDERVKGREGEEEKGMDGRELCSGGRGGKREGW